MSIAVCGGEKRDREDKNHTLVSIKCSQSGAIGKVGYRKIGTERKNRRQ